jgi:hypothetical protein
LIFISHVHNPLLKVHHNCFLPRSFRPIIIVIVNCFTIVHQWS